MTIKLLKSSSSNIRKCPGVFLWEGSDTKEIAENSDKKIQYTLNSQGYRCPEFDEINWEESIITLGCSNTFGIGLDDKDTYSSKLEKITNYPVINLGMGGWSIWQIVYNVRTIAKYNPKYTVLQVPDRGRFALFKPGGTLDSADALGPWVADKRHLNFLDLYNTFDFNSKMYQNFAIDYIDKLLPNGLTYAFSFSNNDREFVDIVDPLDFSRDTIHYGKITHKLAAKTIAKIISSV